MEVEDEAAKTPAAVNPPSAATKNEEVDGEVAVDDGVKGEETEIDTEQTLTENDGDETGVESPLFVAKDEKETSVASGSGRKRKRGRSSKAVVQVKTPPRKAIGEDVCFICLAGGELALCGRRGCSKAYHPSCVDHDEDFFKTKGRWNCGWHLCNNCGKNAYFMCYTCTFSLCKGCCRDAVIFCVKGNKGFCESCMNSVMMIENNDQNKMGSFDDKGSWGYLFKDYWIQQKRKLCITSDDLVQAKNLQKGSDATDKQPMSIEVHNENNDLGTDSDSSLGHLEVVDSKRKKAKKKLKSVDSESDSSPERDPDIKRHTKRRLKSRKKEAYSDSEHSSGNRNTINKRGRKPKRLSKSSSKSASAAGAANEGISAEGGVEWASKELLEFVMHMKNGDNSALTQFDVQGLLLEYIKRNKLRDPRRQSQIICDSMLHNLFGKPRVGHFEMLKLLELHFLLKEDCQADDNHESVVDDGSQLDADGNTDFLIDGSRKGRKFCKKGEERGYQSNLDDYAAIDMHNINLIYVRRNLLEALMEDSETFHDKVVGSFVRIRISGSSQRQDIYRLVQITGTSKAAEPYKVSKKITDVMLEILNLDKTEIILIDTISNQEFTEDECKRLRQSIKCGLLNRMKVGDVLEKARALQEVRVIDGLEAEILRVSHLRDRASEKGRKRELRECVEKLQLLKTPEERQRRLDEFSEVHADPNMDPNCESEEESELSKKRQVSYTRLGEGGFFRRGRDNFSSRNSIDSWSVNVRTPNKNWEPTRNLSGKGYMGRMENTAVASQISEPTLKSGVDKGTSRPNNTQAEYSGMHTAMSPVALSGSSLAPSAGVAQTGAEVGQTEKLWHYRDPAGKAQGPFSVMQLRKWSSTGYFPTDLKIWRISQTEDDSILLTEALAGRFQKLLASVEVHTDMDSKIRNTFSSTDASKHSGDVRGSDYGGSYDSSNLPSPTPARSNAGWDGKQTPESKWSSTPSPFQATTQFHGGNERLPSPTPTSPLSDPSGLVRSNFSQQSKNVSEVGNKVGNMGASVGIVQPASISNSTGHFSSGAGSRLDVSLSSGSLNTQQMPLQSAALVSSQFFTPPNAGMSLPNSSNVTQSGPGQNRAAYAHGWTSGFVLQPEIVNANLSRRNLNAMPQQVPHDPWTGAPVNNQASSYGAGYPPTGNMASNLPTMPSNNSWGPAPTNMQWGGQQLVNSNKERAMAPLAAAFEPSAGTVVTSVGQRPGPAAGAWGGDNWVAPPANSGAWGGDKNRNGGGARWSRQSSFGSVGQRVCKYHATGNCRKGASCDYLHT